MSITTSDTYRGKIEFPTWGFIQEQFTFQRLIWRDLTNKTVVVTGSNTGLGFEAAKHLATMKPGKLILAVRDSQRGNKAADDIESSTGVRPEVQILDLSSFDSVKKFAAKFLETNKRLDILVSNAAISTRERRVTSDGFEATIQTNHLSNMLLIHLLLPILKKTAEEFDTEPRVVVVASEVHAWSSFPQGKYADPIAALNDPKRSEMADRYPVSKLLNVFMTREFAKYLKANGYDNISIHSVNPGFCHSELTRDVPFPLNYVIAFFKALVARTTEQGSRTLIHAAVSEDLHLKNGSNGRYFSCSKENSPSSIALNEKYASAVWNESLGIIKKHMK